MMIRQEVRFWLIHLFYVLFFLFLLNRVFFTSSGLAERSMSYILYPFLKMHKNVIHSMQRQAQDHKTVQNLCKELDALYVQYDVLQGRVAQLEACQIFIQDTAELIDFAQRYQTINKHLAKILMYCCSAQEDIILIEGGVNKNFTKDDILVYQNSLVGRIIEVYPWYSKAALITDQRCRIASQIQASADKESVCGICCGKNNKKMELCFVPHFKPVTVGQTVISTGQGLVYPQGFALGIVQHVKTDLVAHYIQLKPLFDIEHIKYVYVFDKSAKSDPVVHAASIHGSENFKTA